MVRVAEKKRKILTISTFVAGSSSPAGINSCWEYVYCCVKEYYLCHSNIFCETWRPLILESNSFSSTPIRLIKDYSGTCVTKVVGHSLVKNGISDGCSTIEGYLLSSSRIWKAPGNKGVCRVPARPSCHLRFSTLPATFMKLQDIPWVLQWTKLVITPFIF